MKMYHYRLKYYGFSMENYTALSGRRVKYRGSHLAGTSYYLANLIKKFSNIFGRDFYIIYAHWQELVGEEIADYTAPTKIFKQKDMRILQVNVKSSSIGIILEYSKTKIRDQINHLLGKKFIDNISFSYKNL